MTDSIWDLAEQMQEISHARAVIEQAKGILMAVRRCSSQDAFEHLRRIADTENRTITDAAVSVVSKASGQPLA